MADEMTDTTCLERSPTRVIEIVECKKVKNVFIRDNGTGFDMQYAHKLLMNKKLEAKILLAEDNFDELEMGLLVLGKMNFTHCGQVACDGTEAMA